MFNWLGSLIRRSTPLTSAHIFDIFDRPRPLSGVSVNRDTVYGLPAFHRGVSLISSTVARIPCDVFEREEDDGRRKAIEHPAHKLIRRQANNRMPAFVFRRQIVADSLWSGNGYAWIKKNVFGDPIALWRLDPEATFPVIVYGHNLEPEFYYTTYKDGHVINLDPSEVLHVRGLGNRDGLVGMSVIDMAKESLGLGLAVQKYGAVWFKRGGLGATVVELPGTIKTEEAKENYRRGLEAIHTGVENQHKAVILDGGAKLNRQPVTNEEAQFLGSREASAIDVATLLGLPAHKVNSKISTSYSSIEAENLAMLSDCYDPLLVNLEQEFEAKLLTEEQKESDSHYIEFNREALTRADAKSESDLLLNELNNGGLSWEEYRQKRNRRVVKDKKQEWRRPANIVIEGEEPAPAPMPPNAPPVAAEPQEEPEQESEAEQRAKALVRASVSRLVTRLQKDAPQSGKQLAERHSEVFAAALPHSDAWIARFFATLGEELDNVLPEQRAAVLNRLDVNELSEAVWTNGIAI